MRCLNEASLHEDNAFITLTYSDETIPTDGTLRKRDFQLFMKRLRARHGEHTIRFYAAGEYGTRTYRPHYHALLFGFDFGDKAPWTTRNGYPVWRSPLLEELWPVGQSEVGSVTFESAAYVARYMMTKRKGTPEDKEAYYGGREPEFCLMSRRPGIGKAWFDQYQKEVYQADSMIINGHEVKPPRYYDNQYEMACEDEMRNIRRARARARNPDEEEDRRLSIRSKVAEAKTNLFTGRDL